MNSDKNKLIGNTLKDTLNRRKNLSCKTYELKFDKSSFSKEKLDEFNLLFVEAKWLYNHILNLNKDEKFDLFKFNPLIHTVNTLDKDKNVIKKELTVIGSQIKQSVHNRMLDSIKSLSELKKKGLSSGHGHLKFKSSINSIPLKQFDVTYKFHKSKENYVKIQGIKGYSKINGRKQIPKNAEFANATLVKKNTNFYFMITVFVPKAIINFQEESVGLDFGIESTLTTSDGEKFKVNFPEKKRTKRLRMKLSKKQGSKKKSRKSKSYLKILNLVNKCVEKINNKKKDAKNKIVSYLTKKYETICVQDESIKEWKDRKTGGLFGKQVHNSILGGIMSDLKLKSHTLKMIDKFLPTTQLCENCFDLNKFGLEVRIYECHCGYVKDRDIHSANVVDDLGMERIVCVNDKWIRISFKKKKVFGEHKDLKTQVEGCTSFINSGSGNVSRIDDKSVSMNPEAHDFIRG